MSLHSFLSLSLIACVLHVWFCVCMHVCMWAMCMLPMPAHMEISVDDGIFFCSPHYWLRWVQGPLIVPGWSLLFLVVLLASHFLRNAISAPNISVSDMCTAHSLWECVGNLTLGPHP